MSEVLARLLSKIGAEEMPRSTKAGSLFADREGVAEGPELLRIRALPRRRWQDDPALDELVEVMTARYKRPNAEDPNARLFPVQAVALAEAELYQRLTLIASVGSGKTLSSGLLPTALNAKRPLLLVPASLVEKSRKELKRLSLSWRIHPAIQIFSYEKLSLRQYKTFLQDGRYDVIVADESYSLKNEDSGRAKRIADYVAENPNVIFIPCTATPGDSTIGSFLHYFAWAGGDSSPVPKPGTFEALQWQQATDIKVKDLRRKPGALSQFSDGDHELDAVRAGLGRRMEETPGYVFHRHASVDCSLVLDAFVHDDYSRQIEEVFEHVREHEDTMPDNRVIETPLDRFNMFATLNLGFTRVIEPPPPEDWREARRVFRSFVNECIDDRSLQFDTPGEVVFALDRGELDSCGIYEMWKAVEPKFRPVSHVVWFSTEIVELIAAWMKKHDDTLVWCSFPAFSRALAKASGKPFFHRQGISLTAGNIEAYEGRDSVILSTQSNFQGRNLQDRWAKNLIIGGSAKSDLLEQQLGRTHRTGQQADQVQATFFCGSIENFEAIEKARGRALFDRSVGRNNSSKLLECDYLIPEVDEVLRKYKGARWQKAKT